MKNLLFIAIFLLFPVEAQRRLAEENGYPVVIVPGLGGSQFEAKLTGKPSVVHYFCLKKTDDFFDLWLNLELLPLYVMDCWADNMRLVYNESTGMTSNMPGVEIRVPGFGTTENIEWLDKSKASEGRYFTDIVEMLVAMGYKRGKNLLGAPFDWRRAPNEMADFYSNLKTLIENTYKYNSNRKIVIITHSMGSPVMLYFYNKVVDQAWKDKFIKSHISLGGAWGGAMQIVKLLASGYNMDFFRIILPPSRLRSMQRSFISSIFLFPNSNLWNETEMIARVDKKNYSLANLKEFFMDINYLNGWNQYKEVGKMLGNLEAPNIDIHCIYGYNIKTPEIFEWSKDYFPDYQPMSIYGDGDGTVNRRSLEACARWINKNSGKNVTLYGIDKADHMEILRHNKVLKLIAKAVYSDI